MRRYIRHPSDIPIDFRVNDTDQTHANIVDISLGGLCFKSDQPFTIGTRIHIHIPLNFSLGETSAPAILEKFEWDGIVAWCSKDDVGYSIGVQFEDSDTQFGVRMVEQVCHIEHYRYDVLHEQGRHLSSEEAAREWVDRYAAEFPSVN